MYAPGETGNANGRPIGAPNRRSEELRRRLRDRGDKDPAEFCSEIVSSDKEPTELKLAAANYLLPYLYPKRGAVPTPRYIDEPIELLRATTLEQANANIALISEMKAQGQIDLDFADSLIADNRTIADNLIAEEELKLKIAGHGGGSEQTIHITGGLPSLPGSNIIGLGGEPAPQVNGMNGHGPVIEHEQNDSTPQVSQSVSDPEA